MRHEEPPDSHEMCVDCYVTAVGKEARLLAFWRLVGADNHDPFRVDLPVEELLSLARITVSCPCCRTMMTVLAAAVSGVQFLPDRRRFSKCRSCGRQALARQDGSDQKRE